MVKEKDINIISKCNFYPFQYGLNMQAKMRGCLFVQESDNLIFVDYDSSSKRYVTAFKVELKELSCAAIASQDPGKGIVYLYTASNAFTVAMLQDNNDLNYRAVHDLEMKLKSKSIPILELSLSVTNPLYRYKTNVASACPLKLNSAP